MIITFNELRRIKDRLPSGSSQRIADELGTDDDRQYQIQSDRRRHVLHLHHTVRLLQVHEHHTCGYVIP